MGHAFSLLDVTLNLIRQLLLTAVIRVPHLYVQRCAVLVIVVVIDVTPE